MADDEQLLHEDREGEEAGFVFDLQYYLLEYVL
jgi:hypothetical protein